MPLQSKSQRLTLGSARQEWKEHCVAMEERYRKERDILDTRTNHELSALSKPLLQLTDEQRKIEMEKVTAAHKRSVDELEARRRQEAQGYLGTLSYPEPQNGQQQPLTSDPPVPDETKEGIEAKSMGIQRLGAVSAEKESKATEDPCRWVLDGITVRSLPLHTPTSGSSTGDSETLNHKRKADGDNDPYPKKQRTTESTFLTTGSYEPDPIKTLMFEDVRKNAVDGNDWDTIIEWPEQSKQYWVLFCEEHRQHFKQKADNAAAKHLVGSLHGLPNRDRRPAIVHLGYYIPDCTAKLRDSHNAEVNAKYASGYKPRNDYKRDLRGKDLPATASDRSQGKPTRLLAKQATGITEPVEGHIYYAKYEGQYWAVVILGWDKLPDGCRHPTLAASELIKHDPPRCYIFDGFNTILGWKPNYLDKERKSFEKREFPVMYFDDEKNYGWVPAKDLSEFDLHRANAPKKKGYPEGSFNDARDWWAQRSGYQNWEKLSAVRKGLRVKDSAGPQPKSPDTIRSAPQYRAPQARDDSESSVSNPGEMISVPGPDTNSTEKEDTSRNTRNPVLFSFDETLRNLKANPEVCLNSLASDIEDREKPNASTVSRGRIPEGGRSANSTPGQALDPHPELLISTAHSSAPPVSEAPVLAAPGALPVLASPVIVPAASTASLQMPTPQTPTPLAQMATIGGNQAFAADTYEIASYERLITEGDEVQSRLIWQRDNRSEPCVQLTINADGRTAQAQGGPFDLTINPQECRQVRLKTPLGADGLISVHGIGYVTLHLVSGEPSIKMTFDRSDDVEGEMGSKRARYFARWLWGQNPNMKS